MKKKRKRKIGRFLDEEYILDINGFKRIFITFRPLSKPDKRIPLLEHKL